MSQRALFQIERTSAERPKLGEAMSLQRVEVLWSPNNTEEFATYCTELSIYHLQDGEAVNAGGTDLPLSSSVHGRLVGTLPSSVMCIPQNKLVSWQTNSHAPYKFAVGQSSGKVLIIQHGGSEDAHQQNGYMTLSPRSGRPCICVCWNPTESHQLAVGMDKARNDSSLVVWDTTRLTSGEATPTDRTRSGRLGEATTATDDVAKALESGHGEATSSIAWLPGQTSSLAAGMGNRFLRIFDTRDGGAQTRPVQVANHKAILGLSVSPSLPHQLASFAEGSTVFIWDLRHFGKPVYSFTRSATIERLSWLPTRPDCLSIVSKEPPYLHLVDIPSLTISSDIQQEIGDLYMEHLSAHMRDRHPYLTTGGHHKKLVAVEWHPKRTNIALISTMTGKVKRFQVHDRMSLAWNAASGVMYSSSEKLLSATAIDDVIAVKCRDISEVMRDRVAKGYGFNAVQNAKLLEDDVILRNVWEWLAAQEQRQSTASPGKRGRGTIAGVNTVFPIATAGSEGLASSQRSSWEAEGVASRETPPYPIYRSPQRDSALSLCGWSFASDGHSLEDFIKREEMSERYERAAAVSVFRGNVRRGIMTLTDGANLARQRGEKEKASQLQLIALALSGYSPASSQLWSQTCLQMKAHVSSPYLRCVFGFLSSSSSGREDFRFVTSDGEIPLQDRVAVALTYLEDLKLQAFLSGLIKQLVETGNISGLFLTGLPGASSEGLALLKNYVNQTGDVQTACLVAGQVMPAVVKDRMVQGWFQGYRGLLDQWRLWKERAVFDGQRKGRDPLFKPPRQASVTCHFCSKTISGDSLRQDRRAPHLASARKSSSCPNCRKPLPRCALCLLHMVATGTRTPRDTGGSRGNQSEVFGDWFTWCQSCRHGGHASHISQWFSSHEQCPVTGCSCNCYSLDSGSSKF